MKEKNYSLSKSKRLYKKSDFSEFFKNSKRISNHHIRIFYAKSAQLNTRWAFGVSKKIGNAVVRNRIKRQLKNIMRLKQHTLNPNFDLYISCKKSINSLRYSEICDSLIKLLRKKDLYMETDND